MRRYPYPVANLLSGFAGLLICCGCSFHRLDVQTQYLTPEYLASSHVGTPDPRRFQPPTGQRLLIQWSLCEEEISNQDLSLYLKVRYRNHKEEELLTPIRKKRGTILFEVKTPLFCETGGILTYYAAIQTPEVIIAEWKHPLWTELIRVGE